MELALRTADYKSVPHGRHADAQVLMGLSYVNRLHEKRFMRSVEFRLDGTLPATKSAALRNSYGYRYLLTRNLCPHYSVTNVA
jgi:hypothetical protein